MVEWMLKKNASIFLAEWQSNGPYDDPTPRCAMVCPSPLDRPISFIVKSMHWRREPNGLHWRNNGWGTATGEGVRVQKTKKNPSNVKDN